MSTKAYKLLTLLRENLLEVGDLDNISSYDKVETISKGKYQFYSEDGSTVKVHFEKLTPAFAKLIKSPPIIDRSSIKEYYNLGYSVDNQDTQAKKSTIKELLRIMKTISVIVNEWLEINKNCAILILETSKKDSNKVGFGQKSLLYQAVISKNLPAGYLRREIKFAATDGILIGPESKK
jgi:hypothetical protein